MCRKVSSRAERDRTLQREGVWGHPEENVFAEVGGSLCPEVLSVPKNRSVGDDLQGSPTEGAVALRPVRGPHGY